MLCDLTIIFILYRHFWLLFPYRGFKKLPENVCAFLANKHSREFLHKFISDVKSHLGNALCGKSCNLEAGSIENDPQHKACLTMVTILLHIDYFVCLPYNNIVLIFLNSKYIKSDRYRYIFVHLNIGMQIRKYNIFQTK